MNILKKTCLGLVLTLLGTATAAAAYPDKPLTIVVNYPAGGALDLIVRVIAGDVSKQLGETIVVENKAGASGLIGADYVARQKPDGYTLLATIDSLVSVNPYIYKNNKFDPGSLEPLSMLSTFNQVLLVNPASNIKHTDQLMALSKERELNYSSAGPGTPGHLTMESFRLGSGLKAQNIPFNGNAPALNAVLGNQVDAGFLALGGSTFQNIQAGKLTPLAISGKQRDKKLPDVPTVAETGIKGLEGFDMEFSHLLMAPKGVDAGIVQIWNQAMQKAMQSPDVLQKFDNLNLNPVKGGQEEARQWLSTYGAEMKAIIQKADIKVD